MTRPQPGKSPLANVVLAWALILGACDPVMAREGALQICRPDYADKRLNARSLKIPPGVVFDDWGKTTEKVVLPSQTLNLHLVTTRTFFLAPNVRCAEVPTMIARQSKIRAVKPADSRYFEPGGMVNSFGKDLAAPYPPIWDAISQFSATVSRPIE